MGLLLAVPSSASEPEEPIALHFAMVRALRGVHPEDARVAIDLHWTNHLRQTFPNLESVFEHLPDLAAIESRIRQKKLHGFSIDITGFLHLKQWATLRPVFISSRTNQPEESYLLVVARGLDWDQLIQMPRKRLMVEQSESPTIGHMWLETMLQDRQLPPGKLFFSTVGTGDKPSRVLLPVFFGQATACLVPESTFETMSELNPQIRQRLTILERSPGFIKTIHCTTDQMPQHMVDRFLQKGMRMDDTAAGRQLLLIFHVKKNFAFRQSYLNNSEQIFNQYQKIISP